eukprot:GEZU01033526.1.p1 GENE.GEZU01033526.1~~GEZU01033526.1.p1  ORF type:complete len:256 (+),score=65.71 GEZU01033526.1:152-919(+)
MSPETEYNAESETQQHSCEYSNSNSTSVSTAPTADETNNSSNIEDQDRNENKNPAPSDGYVVDLQATSIDSVTTNDGKEINGDNQLSIVVASLQKKKEAKKEAKRQKKLEKKEQKKKSKETKRNDQHAKTYFANERTFLKWCRFSILMLTFGMGIIAFLGRRPGEKLNTSGIIIGMIFATTAVALLLWAFILWVRRSFVLRKHMPNIRIYHDGFGPVFLTICIVGAFVAAITFFFVTLPTTQTVAQQGQSGLVIV